MSKIKLIEVFFSGNTVMKIKDKTFSQVIEMLVTDDKYYLETPPLKIRFPSTGKTICWHEYSFMQYFCSLHGPTMLELVERLQCDDVVRNTTDMQIGSVLVDAGSLWMLRNKTCILVDTDQHLECNYQEELFYPA